MRLSEVPVGGKVVVRRVERGAAGEGRRLEEVGFLAGTAVRVERRAPLGSPVLYELRGSRMALRPADAALVEVEAPSEEGAVGGSLR